MDLLTSEGGPDFDDDIFSTGGATADLSAGTVTGGADVGSDTFTGMDEIGGTLGNDTLTGDGANNRMVSFSGDDTLDGAGGDDYLDGDAFFFDIPENLPGTDDLDGGDGSDTCLGGETVANCEVTEPPAGRKAALAHLRSSRAELKIRYAR